ncbi:CBASS cGAMP-activated phospholipase [Nitrospira moscoviensis]|uniref:Putative Patatin-like phospholipase n=1 Tax=Nitrospira moscoviensis TaxID=42253 RepID=A0A0K2GER8_NITMO|nr:CBASS cGAMP-activated phospholipase [Nitrospira moscoviensis]ALA59443.1 putative Patatin-like phospholipase [Nitrospira moscoviensis]
MSESDAEKFQILSLDGGGIKGLFSASVLAKLEDDLGVSIVDHFDLIVGTSTGGLIALGLGMGMRPRELVRFYVESGPKIFQRSFGLRSFTHWVYRKFPQAPLRDALQECFQDKRLADCTTRLVIPSYNLGDDDVYLFKTPHHERLKRDYKVPLWKVGLATTAAPTYFSSFQELDSLRLIDGGVWANNPTLVGIVEAVSLLRVPFQNISVLSMGTSDPVRYRRRSLDWSGRLGWAKSAVDIVMRGQSLGIHKQAVHLLGDDKVIRIDPRVPEGLFALDRLTTEELLSKAAHESRILSPMFEQMFLSHKASRYEPLYK